MDRDPLHESERRFVEYLRTHSIEKLSPDILGQTVDTLVDIVDNLCAKLAKDGQ